MYGKLPKDLGVIELINCHEMMFYQYYPLKFPGNYLYALEPRLQGFTSLIEKVKEDLTLDEWIDNYAYLTAKRVWVSGENSGNRPGYHSDGFMTSDINYVWCDAAPTIFNTSAFILTPDDKISLEEMKVQASALNEVVYPLRSLLKLD